MESNFLFALSLTFLAGLSTGIGSTLAFFTKKTNTSFLSLSLGFSAGVMIYVSMIEIFFKAKNILISSYGNHLGNWITVIAFFSGILVIAIIDKIIPAYENPHEVNKIEKLKDLTNNNNNNKEFQTNKIQRLKKAGILMAIAISIHNFPEGFATFISALKDPNLGIPIAIAVAIHNIPEGISISVPIYFATKDKKKAFIYSFLSGLAEPLGALIGFFLFKNFISDSLLGILFAFVAGIMVFISIDELLPAAREYGEHHLSIYGFILGMAVMAISLLLFI